MYHSQSWMSIFSLMRLLYITSVIAEVVPFYILSVKFILVIVDIDSEHHEEEGKRQSDGVDNRRNYLSDEQREQ